MKKQYIKPEVLQHALITFETDISYSRYCRGAIGHGMDEGGTYCIYPDGTKVYAPY